MSVDIPTPMLNFLIVDSLTTWENTDPIIKMPTTDNKILFIETVILWKQIYNIILRAIYKCILFRQTQLD